MIVKFVKLKGYSHCLVIVNKLSRFFGPFVSIPVAISIFEPKVANSFLARKFEVFMTISHHRQLLAEHLSLNVI